MRISVDMNDPAFDLALAGRLIAYLDGMVITHCITADEERGEAKCYVTTDTGALALPLLAVWRHGQVRLVPRRAN